MMTKFSDIITLRSVAYTIGDEGTPSRTVNDTDVFFNRYSVSLANRIAGASEGMQKLASGQVRSIEYGGQEVAVLDGDEYTIEDANNQGEFTLLTLARRLSNE